MGSVLYEPQRNALQERFRHITLLLDGDPAGRKASTIIAKTLRPHCVVRVIPLPDGVQPDQLRAESFGKLLQPFANDD
jgi:DNA primase